ncbi:protein transport protein Sft1p [Trichomonascus vanleenenianus]|uniref:Sft1p n=1 Tax=Trichomonascus vanleenenianus TaxID=2268995 RepID=UPI003ECAC491
MSHSTQAYQQEEQNESRLNDLASKITALRNVTNDIHAHASDYSLIDSTADTMSNMLSSVKTTSARLTRSVRAGHPVFKTVGLALLLFFLMYTIVKLF